MTRTRVKETEINPYKPARTRPKRFEGALDKNGVKRSPKKKSWNGIMALIGDYDDRLQDWRENHGFY